MFLREKLAWDPVRSLHRYVKSLVLASVLLAVSAAPALACSLSVSPSSIPANTATDVTVSVLDAPPSGTLYSQIGSIDNASDFNWVDSWAINSIGTNPNDCELGGRAVVIGDYVAQFSRCNYASPKTFDINVTASSNILVGWKTWDPNNDHCSVNLTVESATPTPTPTPTPAPVQIVASPATQNVTVGTPFTVDIAVTATAENPFNAARANVTVSDNLTITSIDTTPTTNACLNFVYTKEPTASSQTGPTFAGAIFGGSSAGCTVYQMTLTPNSAASGPGTISFTSPSIKAYTGSAEILTGVQYGSFTISEAPTPTPTELPQPVVTSPLVAYQGYTYTLRGTKDAAVTEVYVNETAATIEDNTWTWESPNPVALGDNNVFAVYGKNGATQTATQNVHVVGYQLGDVNQDGAVSIDDFSSFLVDWDKTENLTYPLSDLSNPRDDKVDLEDLSRLAPLISLEN